MFVLLGNMQILLVSCISKDSFLVNELKTISFASEYVERNIQSNANMEQERRTFP